MNIKATKSEPPGSDDGQAFPVVHFTGTARALHGWWDPNATSALRGEASGDISILLLTLLNLVNRYSQTYSRRGGSVDYAFFISRVSQADQIPSCMT